jgi:hypothetical protein
MPIKRRASTILGAFEKAQADLVGKPWCWPMGRPVRWRVYGLTNCTACESQSGATMGSGLSRPSNLRRARLMASLFSRVQNMPVEKMG